MKFEKWLETFVKEKNIDLEDIFTITKNDRTHIFDYNYIIETIKVAPAHEQNAIKNMLVKIDFVNGDVCHYFRHLANALV